MKLRVIGTGSSGNCYALMSGNGDILLLDCGLNFKTILKGVNHNIGNVVGCLASHCHKDHILAHKSILDSEIYIYTNKELKAEIGANRRTVRRVDEKQTFSAGEFRAIPFYLPHSMYEKDTGFLTKCPNYGYLINHSCCGKILYATDMEYLPYNFQKQKINHMIIECNYVEEMIEDDETIIHHRLKGHCGLNTCVEAIKANMTDELKTITLIHLSETRCDENIILERIKSIVPESVTVNIAKAGLEINLGE